MPTGHTSDLACPQVTTGLNKELKVKIRYKKNVKNIENFIKKRKKRKRAEKKEK